MRYAVLGTGIVGRTLGSGLIAAGHEVTLGARDKDNPTAVAWAAEAGPRAAAGTFADAAAAAETVVNATSGAHSLEALEAAGAANLAGKILVDVANALSFLEGRHLLIDATTPDGAADGLGARIQRAFPQARVVKTLNTMTAAVMADPSLVPGEHVVFLSGDDAEAKAAVRDGILADLGWPASRTVDLGDLATARAAELYVTLWFDVMLAKGHPNFNIQIHTAD